MLMRMMVDGYLGRTAGMGSPGIDEVKWLKPVYAGETLRGRMTVLAKRQSPRAGPKWVSSPCAGKRNPRRARPRAT